MSSNRKLSLIALSSFIIGCSSTPYLDDYLAAVDVPAAYIYFKHEKHGLLNNQQRPLKEDFERCNEYVFKDGSFTLADKELVDLAMLEQVNQDYHAFLFESVMMSGSEGKDALGALYSKTSTKRASNTLSREAFGYTEGLSTSLKSLTRLILKRNSCLSEKGWLYKYIKY